MKKELYRDAWGVIWRVIWLGIYREDCKTRIKMVESDDWGIGLWDNGNGLERVYEIN